MSKLSFQRKDEGKLAVYILLYLYYTFGIYFHLLFMVPDSNIVKLGVFTPFILLFLCRPMIGLFIAVVLLLAKPESLYKRCIFPKSNQILLTSFIIDNVIIFLLSINNSISLFDYILSLLFLFTGAYLPFYLVYLGHHFLQYLQERKN